MLEELLTENERNIRYARRALEYAGKDDYFSAIRQLELFRLHEGHTIISSDALERLITEFQTETDYFPTGSQTYEALQPEEQFKVIMHQVIRDGFFAPDTDEWHFLEHRLFRYVEQGLLHQRSEPGYHFRLSQLFHERKVEYLSKVIVAGIKQSMMLHHETIFDRTQEIDGSRHVVLADDHYIFKQVDDIAELKAIDEHFSKLPHAVLPLTYERLDMPDADDGVAHGYEYLTMSDEEFDAHIKNTTRTFAITPIVDRTLDELVNTLPEPEKQSIFDQAIKQLLEIQHCGKAIITDAVSKDYYHEHLMDIFASLELGDILPVSLERVFEPFSEAISPRLAAWSEPVYYKDNNLRNLITYHGDVFEIDFEGTQGMHPAIDLVNTLEFGSSYMTPHQISHFVSNYVDRSNTEQGTVIEAKPFLLDYAHARAQRHLALAFYRTRDLRTNRQELDRRDFHFAQSSNALQTILSEADSRREQLALQEALNSLESLYKTISNISS